MAQYKRQGRDLDARFFTMAANSNVIAVKLKDPALVFFRALCFGFLYDCKLHIQTAGRRP